ncbi:MAG: type II CAAX endopeptidase family protein [Synechocystis sp.]|nr:type II CAAX endopeptidase family protein [Synechocystis sp.]
MKTNLGMAIANLPTPLRIASFLLFLLSNWLPIAVPVYLLIDDDNLRTILVMAALFVTFLGQLIFWSHWRYQTPLSLAAYQVYGLGWNRRQGRELLQGLGLGFAFTFGLFSLAALLGWVTLLSSSQRLWLTIAEGSLTGLGVAFAEELFFRGWLLKELETGYSPRVALVSNGLIFAGLHFLKPLSEVIRTLPQFPALALLGFCLVITKRRHGDRLAASVGLHGGLVWAYYIINVGGLVAYTERVPEWVTGIDRNPLSGLLGISFLVLLLLWVSRGASPPQMAADTPPSPGDQWGSR